MDKLEYTVFGKNMETSLLPATVFTGSFTKSSLGNFALEMLADLRTPVVNLALYNLNFRSCVCSAVKVILLSYVPAKSSLDKPGM